MLIKIEGNEIELNYAMLHLQFQEKEKLVGGVKKFVWKDFNLERNEIEYGMLKDQMSRSIENKSI